MSDPTRWPGLKRGLVAILRGITPSEAETAAEILIEEGFEALEVPLNSPDPLQSIGRMVRGFGDRALIGGGTMLSVAHVDQVADQGGRLMVSPNMRPAVIRHAVARGMVTMPGVLTPTEAFDALDAGAAGLKFFPASLMGPAGIQALMAVLPKGTVVGAVGGVTPENMADYLRAGVTTFGMGTAVYRPGDSADEIRRKARALVAAYDANFPA
ncbi:2-dehydro-3-deoxy-6-phosphogalactonate aldolase [Xinfangfangia sp. D13-10-4-6]|uniref:2-dehydro-3-deoxy-6-phosphogalactonate aldolase n=1 Tax=Pseudogemmobacter hezensis TaxID=2737662 RepID=UPI001557DF95|nr:2-dehydro-3-deoxy-6-phosphogalactonate aldolase [Pseudogemmobacter hezensis]NPD16003.1 2-dehydro-3-deoxy-6-phosphogalactonate aldolase [Pseudogemmobacter hezensis]